MKTEKQDVSPFAALSFSQQQDKWREWRSRQLEYKSAVEETPPREAPGQEVTPPPRPQPTRHRELDKVLSRHQMAVRRAGAFQVTGENGPQPR